MKLPRSRRITASGEFKFVRQHGESKGSRTLVMAAARSPREGETRFGFITSKRVGGAVVRNLVRRRLRAIVREAGEGLSPGHLVVTIARPAAASASYSRLRSDWRWLARKLGLDRSPAPVAGRGSRGGAGDGGAPRRSRTGEDGVGPSRAAEGGETP